MECVNAAVGRCFTTLRQTGDGPASFWVKPRQSLKQTLNDAHFDLAGNDGRVERFGFAAVDDRDVGGRLVVNAAGEQNDAAK